MRRFTAIPLWIKRHLFEHRVSAADSDSDKRLRGACLDKAPADTKEEKDSAQE